MRKTRDNLPDKYNGTKVILSQIFQALKEGYKSIDYRKYNDMREFFIDLMMELNGLQEKDRETLSEYFNRWFADLAGLNIVIPRKLNDQGNPVLAEGFDIGISVPKKFPHVDSVEIETISGLATSPFRDQFSDKMIEGPLKDLGSHFVYPEEPSSDMILMMIPAIREATIRHFVQALPDRLATLARNVKKSKEKGDEKGVFENTKTIKRYLDYCEQYGIEIPFSDIKSR